MKKPVIVRSSSPHEYGDFEGIFDSVRDLVTSQEYLFPNEKKSNYVLNDECPTQKDETTDESQIFENLPKALENGKDIEARGALLIAANLAGIAFNHAMVGVVHAVAHTIGGLFHLHHGTANSIFLPYGMEYNLDVRESEIASLAPFLGIPSPSPRACIDAVKKFKRLLKEKSGHQ